MYAREIVQENKATQEIIGSQETVDQIWSVFDKRYEEDRAPGQEILKELMSNTAVQTSDPKSLWRFVDQCSMVARVMVKDDAVRST